MSVTDRLIVSVPAAAKVNVATEPSVFKVGVTVEVHVYVNGEFPFVVEAVHTTWWAVVVDLQVKSTENGATTTVKLCCPETAAASVVVNVTEKVPAAA